MELSKMRAASPNHSGLKWSGSYMRGIRLAAVLPMVIATIACESLLEVDIPGRVPGTALDDPTLASTLVLGAQADFECGWSEYVLTESMFTDEFIVATSIVTVTVTDARTAQLQASGNNSCTTSRNRRSISPYRPVQLARFQAEDVYKRITAFEGVANKESHLSKLALYAGFMHTLLGEGYCDLTTAINGGPRESKVSLWNKAETWFGTAIGHAEAAGNTSEKLAATLGRARVRLNLGNTAGAVSDASAIPVDFQYDVTRDGSVPSRDNQIYQQSGLQNHHSLDPLFRNLTISAAGKQTQGDGVADPRVPNYSGVSVGQQYGEDGFTPMWYQGKYTSLADPYPLATWREALLIIAEVQLGQTAVDNINILRDRHSLPNYVPASVSDATEILNAVIEEKRRETFVEGHRINEMQRHNLAWQEGLTHRGLNYGEFHCLPEFHSEKDNNANF
jgi:hypothetical protein